MVIVLRYRNSHHKEMEVACNCHFHHIPVCRHLLWLANPFVILWHKTAYDLE